MRVGMGVTTMEGMWSQLRGWHLGVGGGVLGEGLRVQIQTQRNTWGRGGTGGGGPGDSVVGSHERRWSVQAAAIAPVWGFGVWGCGHMSPRGWVGHCGDVGAV